MDERHPLQRGVTDGWIERPRRTALTEAHPLPGRVPIAEALDEDRADGSIGPPQG